jgi:acetate kinase
MNNYILALNCGSSSLKFTLFMIVEHNKLEHNLSGIVEEIGNVEKSRLKFELNDEKTIRDMRLSNHRDALEAVFNVFEEFNIQKNDIKSIGHRVVHGGTKYNQSILIDQQVLNTIEELIPIAPLHNPPNLLGIKVAMEVMGDVPQVAIFDTAFHGTLPEYAFRYAIPEQWYKEFGVRTYGFHGTSHMYVSKRAASIIGKSYDTFNGITAHLGNGSSLAKIQNGKSVDTSMGFTPLEGVIMGTRSGDIDPAIISHVVNNLMVKEGIQHEEAFDIVMNALNKESGLKALGKTNMMQDIRKKAESGDVQAELVISIYAYRIAKYIGAYWATLDGCDTLIFTAGLGENEGYVRKKIASFLPNIGIEIDDEKNAIRKEEIQIGQSKSHGLKVMVIPTDEEIVIAYDAFYLGHLKKRLPDKYPFE